LLAPVGLRQYRPARKPSVDFVFTKLGEPSVSMPQNVPMLFVQARSVSAINHAFSTVPGYRRLAVARAPQTQPDALSEFKQVRVRVGLRVRTRHVFK